MQQQTSNKKTITIVVIVAIVLIGAGVLFYMSGSPTETDPSLVADSQTSTEAGEAGVRVLGLLNQIKVIKIESSFFEKPAYTTLVDHTVPINEQPIGKSNPFLNPRPAPITTSH